MLTGRRVILCSVTILFLVHINLLVVRAQTNTGAILGIVNDSSSATVASAHISVKNVETGSVRDVETDATGAYTVVGLPAGSYIVQADANGFSTRVIKGITLTVAATLRVNVTLAVSSVKSEITVMSETTQVDTTTASTGDVVTGQVIRELPLNGRDWLQLATLQAGVVGGIGQSAASVNSDRVSKGNGETLSIAGNRQTQNVYLIDGLVENDYANGSPGSALSINLGVDAIREFSVLTSEFSAEYGMTAGGVVNAVFKSGTNQLHGSGYGFFRNSAMDARNYFDGPAIPPFQRYQYGASLGGPIIKDKTFFFANFEGVNQNLSLSSTAPTLSPNALKGILQCVPGIPACANGAPTYQVTIAPAIVPYLALFPPANTGINGDSGFLSIPLPIGGHEYYTVGRLDHNFSQATSLSASMQWDTGRTTQPDAYQFVLGSSPTSHDNFVAALQHSFSSNLLNTARFGVSRTYAANPLSNNAINPLAADTSLGFVTGKPVGFITAGPANTFGGLGATGPDEFWFTSYQASDDVSWIRGRHHFQFGGFFDRIDSNFNAGNDPNGSWSFGSVSDFLLDIPQAFASDLPGTPSPREQRQSIFGLYAHDTIILRPNLTLNVGLRWEPATPVTDAKGKVSNLPTLSSATARLGGAFWLNNPTLKDFEPRIGIVWDPTGSGKTSIRSGFGIYDIIPMGYLLIDRTHAEPFYLGGIVNNPPPSSFPSQAISLIGPAEFRGAYVQSHIPVAYNQQWNFTVQRQLAANTTLEAGYVGSHSVHLPEAIDDMDVVPLSQVTIAPDGNYLFPIPPAGSSPQRVNPNFARILATLWRNYSIYNGLLLTVNSRFSHGVSLRANYTWSHDTDENSSTYSATEYGNTTGDPYGFLPSYQKGPADFNVVHNLIVNGMWDIPLANSFSGTKRAILAGWELGAIFNEHSGMHTSATLSNDQAFTGNSEAINSLGGQRANYNPSIPGCSGNPVNPGQPNNYIKAQCFSFPNPGELGNSRRNMIWGPWNSELDLSLFKNISIKSDRYRVQFRAEAFNILNHANFGMGDAPMFDANGNVNPTSLALQAPTLTTSRQIQFGAKFVW